MVKGNRIKGGARTPPRPTVNGFSSSDSALMSKIQGPTYAGMGALSKEVDPYEMNREPVDQDAFEARMENHPTATDVAADENGYDEPDVDLTPKKQQVLEEFEEYLEAHRPLKKSDEDALRNMGIDEKWKTIIQEQGRAPIFSAKHYIDALKEHSDGTKKSRPSFWKSQGRPGGTGTLGGVLTKLKLDLKMSHERFVEDFVDSPNNGADQLALLIADIGKDIVNLSNSRDKQELFAQAMLDEYYCLLCIKFIMRTEEGHNAVLKSSLVLESVAQCLYSDNLQLSLTALQILTQACQAPSGQQQVSDVMTTLRMKFSETVRFKILVSMLNKQPQMAFQVACVHFFNTLWRCTDNVNAKVFLQHELHLAGFDPEALDKNALSTSSETDELKQELDTWRANYIEVSGSRQKAIELESRNTQLRQEIDRLQIRIQTADNVNQKLQQSLAEWKDKSEKYRERAAELQDTISKLTNLYRERTGLNPEEEVNLEEAIKSLDVYGTTRSYGTNRSSRGTIASASDPPSMPPAPPLPKPMSETIRCKVTPRVSLPMLNWTPLLTTKGTVFETLDDQEFLREMDFVQFETEFQLPSRAEGYKSRQKRAQAISKYNNQIHFVEPNRAKNMIITKTRIAKGVQQRLFWEDPLSSRDIKDAIEKCDLDIVPGEYAELLLKYVPTKDEVKKLAENAKDYAQMGEAEQFLFQLAQVERLESKLSMMAFIGIFSEMLVSIVPQIESVSQSSQSVLYSGKFKKILQIILAYGNYMNSCKRGYSLGFKLDSLAKLEDVKSLNRDKTLLHHLVEVIESKYPDLANFYDEVDVKVEKGVSYQALASDMHGLRKGIDLVKYEMEKQPNNIILQKFHSHASAAIAKIAESFHKMEDLYRKVCSGFGENAKKIEPDEFFGQVTSFITAFKNAAKDLHAQRNSSTSSQPKSPVSPNSPVKVASPTNKASPPKEPVITMVQSRTIDFTEEANTLVSRSREKRPSIRKSEQAGVSVTYVDGKEDDEVFVQELDQMAATYAQVQRTTSGAQSNPQKVKKEIVVQNVGKTLQLTPAAQKGKVNQNGALKNGMAAPQQVSPEIRLPSGYEEQLNEAIDSLDQVLDDADGPPAACSEYSRL